MADHAIDRVAGELLHVAEHDHRENRGDEQRGQRSADESERTTPRGFALTGQIHDGSGEHKHDRQQDDGDCGCEGRAVFRGFWRFGLSLVFGGGDRHPLGGEFAEDRAGDDYGWDGYEQAECQGDAKVGVQCADCGERAGVRRHERVQGGKACEGRNAQQHNRCLGAAGCEEHHRNENDYADFEEHGNADDERD